jgi:hypothetical protein
MREDIFNEFTNEVADSLSKQLYGKEHEMTNSVFMETIILTTILETSKKMKNKLMNNPHYGVKKEDVNQVVIDIATEINARLRNHFSL